MSGPTSTERALLLRHGPSGESFLKLDLLSAESGTLVCLKRISKKQPHRGAPDLFDTARIELETGRQGNVRFVRDYHPEIRRNRIGQSYARLQHAAAYSGLLLLNAAHMPDTATLFALAERTFDAFESGRASDIVLLKGLFLILRDEGYPVNESWWPQVPPALRDSARALLNQPIPESPEPPALEACRQLQDHLCQWLRRETELILPDNLIE
jgi:recombinational DNA repair protein (RecF pathway)